MKKAFTLILVTVCSASWGITNLIDNGQFDAPDRGQGWSHTGGGGTYFYDTGDGDSICSMGWWDKYGIWRGTPQTFEANTRYIFQVIARSGDGKLEGVRASLIDTTDSWNHLVDQEFWFPAEDQGIEPGPWHTYTFEFDTTAYPEVIGHNIGIGISCADTESWGNYGWLHIDQVGLYIKQATDPMPADSAVDAGTIAEGKVTVDLQWNSAPDSTDISLPDGSITSHILYLKADDPNVDTVEAIVIPAGSPVNATVTHTQAGLEFDTQYYWRIDETLDGDPNALTGPVWSFRTIPQTPVVAVSPSDTLVAAGDTAVFRTVIDNAATYQWYQSVDALTDTANDTPVGENNPELQLANVALTDSGSYLYCVGANGAGTVLTEPAMLQVKQLVGYWPLDDTLTDASGHHWDAYYKDPNSNNPDPAATFVDGISGSALDSSSAGYYALVAGSEEAFNFYHLGLTVSVWVKSTQTDWGGVVTKQYRTDSEPWTGWILDVTNTGATSFNIRGTGGLNAGEPVVNDGQWHMLTSVYDADGTLMKLYIDGLLEQAIEEADPVGKTTAPLIFGAERVSGETPFVGQIDEIKIWNYPLNSIDVANSYLAVMPEGTSICIDKAYPQFDFNLDCRVDMKDFAAFAAGWMECNLAPDCLD